MNNIKFIIFKLVISILYGKIDTVNVRIKIVMTPHPIKQ